MAYTVFSKKSSRSLPPAVTITAAGRIGLNAELARIFRQNNIETVLLLSDVEKRKIALQPTETKDKRSYRVAYASDLSQASMTARRFLGELGWDGKLYDRIPAEWNKENCLLEFEMPRWGRPREIGSVSSREKKTG